MKKLYIKNYKKKQRDSVEDLLAFFYKKGTKETYTDIECTVLQCKIGKKRSFDDLMLLVNTYFEDTSLEVVCNTIKKLLLVNNLAEILYCPNVNKWVVYNTSAIYISSYKLYKFTSLYRNSYLQYRRKGSGEYTLKTILDILVGKDNHIPFMGKYNYIYNKLIKKEEVSNKLENTDN